MAYRNQSDTMSQIAMLSRMRITTTTEAVAYLRAVQPLNEQVAAVLQTASLRRQQAINRAIPAPVQPQPQPTQPVEPVEQAKFQPEDLSSDEGYSDAEIEARVNTLKSTKLNNAKAKKAKKADKLKEDK